MGCRISPACIIDSPFLSGEPWNCTACRALNAVPDSGERGPQLGVLLQEGYSVPAIGQVLIGAIQSCTCLLCAFRQPQLPGQVHGNNSCRLVGDGPRLLGMLSQLSELAVHSVDGIFDSGALIRLAYEDVHFHERVLDFMKLFDVRDAVGADGTGLATKIPQA